MRLYIVIVLFLCCSTLCAFDVEVQYGEYGNPFIGKARTIDTEKFKGNTEAFFSLKLYPSCKISPGIFISGKNDEELPLQAITIRCGDMETIGLCYFKDSVAFMIADKAKRRTVNVVCK